FRLRMLHVTSSATIGEFWRILALNCSESEFRSVIRQTLSLQLSNLRKFTARLQQKSTADYTSCHRYCNLKTIDRVPGFSLRSNISVTYMLSIPILASVGVGTRSASYIPKIQMSQGIPRGAELLYPR